jgi:protein phosphatase
VSSPIVTPSCITPHLPRLEAFGLTHRGHVRAVNEDAYLVDPALGLFVVADGVGGCAAGDVAARLAVEAVREDLREMLVPGSVGVLFLAAAFQRVNVLVREAGRSVRGRAGMSTTLTAIRVQGSRAAIAHVGDSRAYRLRGFCLEQLTEDHTLVAACRNAGLLSAEEAASSEVRHVILRAVGAEEHLQVDSGIVLLEPGDTLLLCSDGLHGATGDDEIGAILLAERDLERAAEELVRSANDRGGLDNVTVVLLRIGQGP